MLFNFISRSMRDESDKATTPPIKNYIAQHTLGWKYAMRILYCDGFTQV